MAVYFRGGDVADLKAAVRAVPRILAGLEADTYDIVTGFKLRLANALLSQIWQDFITKSRGGTGRDGIKWPPLSPATIAQRRTTAGERKALGIDGDRVRGLLTPAENEEWLRIFRRTYARLRFTLGESQAKGIAFGHAWNELKKQGAKTKLAVLGGRVVDILRDTGLLFRSLSPGVDDERPDNEGQICRTGVPGVVTVGTKQKPWHHRGIPGKLPARPFWPLDGGIPPAWMPAIRRAAIRGLRRAVEIVTQRMAKGG